MASGGAQETTPSSEQEQREQQQCDEALKLSELLERGWRLYEELESSSEPTNSNPLQVKVRRALAMMQEAHRRVEQLQLFSRNEELEEVATADLKYLLLPALLAALTLKQVNAAKRLEHLDAARLHFTRFLQRCSDYGVSRFHVPKNAEQVEDEDGGESGSRVTAHTSQPSLVAMAAQRQAKIQRFMERKETESKLAEVRAQVETGSADDEVLREFYLLQVRRWIPIALEEVDSIQQEIQILHRMDGLKQTPVQPSLTRKPPMKPFILTKDAVQAKVFGAGYPSLATMTVDDWYEQHKKKGCLPDQGLPRSTAEVDAEEREREEKERKEEEEDEEALQKARDWDDWKDTHRRGYGNRQNMG